MASSSVVVASASPATDIQKQFEVLPSVAGVPGWLGADSDVSIVIGGGPTGRRALWIFADTYISEYYASKEQRDWPGKQMPHSTVALVECTKPAVAAAAGVVQRECTAPPRFYWKTGEDNHTTKTFWVLPPSPPAPVKPLLWPVAGLASRDGTKVILLAQRILGGLNLVGSDAIVIHDVTPDNPTKWTYKTTPILPRGSNGGTFSTQ